MNENFENNISDAADNASETLNNAASAIEENISDTVSGVEAAPKKKTGAKIAAVGVGAVVLLGGGGVAAYNLSDAVKNQVKLSTSSPEEYFTWVLEENSNKSADSVAEAYDKYLDAYKEGQSASVALKYEASDDVKALLLENVLGTEYESTADEQTQKLIDVINDINTIEIGADSAVKDNIVTGSVYGSLNDEKLISADLAVDAEALGYYFRIPELTEKWLGMDLSSIMEEAYASSGVSGSAELMNKLYQNPEDIISAEEVDDLLTRYLTVWNSELDEVELEKKEKVEIGDIEVEYTVITAEIDGKIAYNVVDAILGELEDDKLVKEIVTERLEICSEDEYDSLIEEAVESFKAEKDYMYESEESLELVTYVDAKGVIRGVNFEIPEADTAFDYCIGLEDDKLYGQFILNDGTESVEIILNGTKDKKAYDGEITIDVNGEEVGAVEFKDFEVVDEELGYVKGDISVVIPDIEPISFTLDSDGKSQELSLALDIDGTDYGKVTLSMASDKAKDVDMPNTDDAVMIDIESGEFDITSYITEEDVSGFAKGLLDKIFGDAFTEEEKNELADSAAVAFFEGYNSSGMEDDYLYEDDYDWDEDYTYDDDFTWEEDFTYEDEFDWDEDYTYEEATENPYVASAVEAEEGQAYINVMDYAWDAEYWGDSWDNLSYDAKVATVDKDGQYTVAVTADTDGYRFDRTGDASDASMLPNGIDYLSVCIEGGDYLYPDALIKIDSVKIDGKDMPLVSNNYTTWESYCTEGVIYCEWYSTPDDAKCADGDVADTSSMIIDAANITEWTTIEVTFTVSGIA